MDLSGEIAYPAHNLEDALRMKFFTIDDLLYEFEKSDFSGCFKLLQNIVIGAKKFADKA